METPVIHGPENILKQAGKSGFALLPIQSFIPGIAIVLKFPVGRGGELLKKTGLRAGETAGALEGGGRQTGAMTGGDQLGEKRVNVVSIGIHAIPDGTDTEEEEG